MTQDQIDKIMQEAVEPPTFKMYEVVYPDPLNEGKPTKIGVTALRPAMMQDGGLLFLSTDGDGTQDGENYFLCGFSEWYYFKRVKEPTN